MNLEQKNLTDPQLKDLLEETFKKLKSTADQDSKKLSDMNTTLNWVLTLSTVFFVFYTRTKLESQCGWEMIVSNISKISFVIITVILIIHKIFYIRYEDFKGLYLATLHTHLIDLKFNLHFLRQRLDVLGRFATYMFINSFRNGEFLYHYGASKSKEEFIQLNTKIQNSGNWLKRTYWLGLLFFTLSFLSMCYSLFN
jgi:hypothetical protein